MTISDVLAQWTQLQEKHRPVTPQTNIYTKERGNTYQSRNAILKQMGFADYSAYRQSNLWNDIKLRLWQTKGRLCDICRGQADTIPHRSYGLPTLTGETLDYLVPICCECHERVEFTESGYKRTHEQAETVYQQMKAR